MTKRKQKATEMAESQNVSLQSTPIPTSASEAASFEEPQASKIFRIIFFSLTTLASLLGNSVMLKAASAYPSRKPLSYHLVTNLAAAEIISTLCLIFTFIYVYLDHWPFGEFACTVTIPLQVLSLFVVTNTLAAIAAYRFIFIVFHIRITVTNCRLILFFSLLWLVALAVSMPLFLFLEVDLYKGDSFCIMPNVRSSHDYEIARFILNFGLPYLIMVMSYAAMATKLRKHIKRSRKEAVEMSKLGETTNQTQEEEEPIQQQDTEATNRERRKSSRAIVDRENDLLKMIYTIIIVFAVCYLPYQVQFFFYIFDGYERYPEAKQYKKIIREYSLLLTSLSSALHPLCYGTMNKFYAKFFSRLVLCSCKSE